jgi:hypothetical protein
LADVFCVLRDGGVVDVYLFCAASAERRDFVELVGEYGVSE